MPNAAGRHRFAGESISLPRAFLLAFLIEIVLLASSYRALVTGWHAHPEREPLEVHRVDLAPVPTPPPQPTPVPTSTPAPQPLQETPPPAEVLDRVTRRARPRPTPKAMPEAPPERPRPAAEPAPTPPPAALPSPAPGPSPAPVAEPTPAVQAVPAAPPVVDAPKSNAAPATPVPLGGDAERSSAPVVKVKPVYPKNALKMGQEATLVARLAVGRDGLVTQAEIVQCSPPELRHMFEKAVLDAVRQYRFLPEGKPFQADQEIVFKMGEDE